MCGIVAIWSWAGPPISATALLAAAVAQRHRGPDGHGYAIWYADPQRPAAIWRGPNISSPSLPAAPIRVGLAHNWLAIQDRTDDARQPMTLPTERYWLAFNGEIYNFIELRAELAAAGTHVATASDTEVLLALWALRGPQALGALRGMFAFVLYDAQDDVLWVARDRFGIKPVYYALLPGNGGLIIASELRAIHASGLIPRALDELAVQAFLAAGINKPAADRTLFTGVDELPPGTLLEIRPGQLRRHSYYRLPPVQPELGAEALPELRQRFIETIQLHMRSAREVGTCLSGGLDSTNIAYVLGQSHADFKAFSLGQPASPDLALAQLAARSTGMRHDLLYAPKTAALGDLVDMLVACELPNHTWGPLNQYLLLRHIHHAHGIAVLLNGQGGDEVFSGYPWFFPLLTRAVAEAGEPSAAEALRRSFAARPPLPPALLATTTEMYRSRRAWIAALDEGALELLGLAADELLGWAPVRYYLNDELDWNSFREHEFSRRELQHLLRHEDRLGMWFSIENRVPFLDHQLVELIGRLKPEFLIGEGYLKYPLRRLFPELPRELRLHVTKYGFWEPYSSLPPRFDQLVGRACRASSLSALRQLDPSRVAALRPIALWRFFQVAALAECPTATTAQEWVRDLEASMVGGRISAAASANRSPQDDRARETGGAELDAVSLGGATIMTNQMLSLAELIAPVDLGTFWGEYWEQQTLHVKRDKPHHYDHIFALRDLDTLLAYHNAPGVPLYSVANRSPLVPQMSPPTARDAFDTYYQGNTLFIASVHQRWQPIAEMCRQTEDVLRHPVGATMVLSPKGAQGLSVHHDAADVFVLQLEGEKDWQVYTPTYPLPLEGAGLQEAALEGVPSQIVRLRAGDMMYVPRGFPHKAFTSEQMSLHLSMYVNVIRWKDFLSQVLLQVSEEHVEFRQGLPVGFLASGQQIETVEQELYRRLELLREHTHVEAAIQRMTANFIQQMLPLPDGQFVQVDRLDAITLDTTMTKRAGMICQVSGNSTSAEIRFPGSMVNGPAYLEPALRFIAETETFSVAELPGNMSDKSRVVLVRRLVREGLLRTLERPA